MLTHKTRVRDRRGRPRQRALKPRKLPGQARSRDTVRVILEASARILESDGLRGFNTNAVAIRAGVSVGSLYQYFPNKDAILLALIGRYEEELYQAVVEAAHLGKGLDLKPRLRLLVRALVMVHYRRPQLNRLLEAEEERLGSGADSSAFQHTVLQLLRDHRCRMGAPVSRSAVQVSIAILRAVIDLGLEAGASPRTTEHRAMRAVCGYLLHAG